MRRVALLGLGLVALFAIGTSIPTATAAPTLVFSAGFDIGYMNIPPANLPWNSINVLIDFPIITSPKRDGSIDTAAGGLTPQSMQADVAAAHARGKKALISIGGADDLNWDAACNSANRAKFAANLAGIVKTYGYDGADLDIEQDFGYPNYVDLIACVSGIHDALKANSASAMLTNDTDPTWMAYFASHIASYFDYLMFMNYWQTASQLPTMVAAYTNFGIPASKLVTGLGTDPTDPTQVDIGASPDILAKIQYALNHGMAGVMNWYITTPTAGTNTIALYVSGTPPTLPTVTAVAPTSGPAAGGTSVTITGTNFTGATAVKFGTATATYTVTSATQIMATSPPGSGTVDVTVTGPSGTSAVSAADRFIYTAPPAAYIAQSPNRILDTRSSGQTLSGGGSLNLTVVGGTSGVPATATGVVLNVTVTNTTAPSFLKVGPAGAAAATVSNLNWVAGETRANLVNVPVGSGGQVSIFNGVGSADVVVDEEGYFAAPVGTAGGYNALPPQRLLDTRSSGQTMSTGSTIDLQVLGAGGVPATGVSAIVLNATATKTATQGYFTIYPSGTTRPTASNVNWAAGWTLPNLVIVKVGSNGKVSIYNGQGASDAVIDVSGYFTDSTASGKLFIPLTPARILDTRVSGGTIGPNGTLSNLQITGNNGVPAGATAVFLNTTVTNTTASSALTVFPGPTKPTASDLNWMAGQTIPNLALATLSSTGTTSFYNFVGSTDLVLDLSGWFS